MTVDLLPLGLFVLVCCALAGPPRRLSASSSSQLEIETAREEWRVAVQQAIAADELAEKARQRAADAGQKVRELEAAYAAHDEDGGGASSIEGRPASSASSASVSNVYAGGDQDEDNFFGREWAAATQTAIGMHPPS